MTSPTNAGSGPRFIPRPLLISSEERSSLGTRSGTLASLIRHRSQQNVVGSWPSPTYHNVASDEEAASSPMFRGSKPREHEEVERLILDERRMSRILNGPPASRSMGLIGKNNPRYRWERYWKHQDELKLLKPSLYVAISTKQPEYPGIELMTCRRRYYERTNELIEQYLYIDCLLDSAIPHQLLDEYSAELDASAFTSRNVPDTIEEESTPGSFSSPGSYGTTDNSTKQAPTASPLNFRRTPKDIFRPTEDMPLLLSHDSQDSPRTNPTTAAPGPKPNLPWLDDAEVEGDDPIVTLAIWVNMAANVILLAGKLVVVVSVPSMSVLASLVDAVLDFLSTAIVWVTMRLISASQKDQYNYPIGRRRLEPLGVLVFSIIMITSFVQVSLESFQRLVGPNHEILQLGIPAIAIMLGTVIIKGACWLWCRLVKNSSVRALAEDAKTDVIFNIGSILFPIVGFYARIWWLDALGGLLLSLVVIINWSKTSAHHVRNLTGFSAQPDERNLLLYLTMRFATAIRKIQNLRAYHAGDKLFVEVDIVLSANTPLKDSHDLSEVLTYVLEAVPIVDRAFVHVDYTTYNAPTHMLKSTSI
ncbi:hypothetical protein S40293_00336 [Stachybotrys chartarum IBT 40293]|nr:hypothetical protein S40293_00336 [Stachybotrys chartarum IBT 40293]